jgi:hydroxyethylthiazole kinase-like uncharacterized protein yjeF
MTELLTAAQMRAIEQAAIASGEVTGLELMERAGRGVVEAIFEEWPELRATSHRAVVLCGPGNNGGDGFVVARLLKEWGWEVEVFLYGDPLKLPPDARVNYERWAAMGEVNPVSDGSLDKKRHAGAVIIDALFGSGLTRPLENAAADIQRRLLGLKGPTAPRKALVAVDSPSGLCLDSGLPIQRGAGAAGMYVPAADLTVTFQRRKLGHVIGQGPLHCGRVVVVDIGLDKAICDAAAGRSANAIDPIAARAYVREVARPGTTEGAYHFASGAAIRLGKRVDLHKYHQGHAIVVSGGPGRGGAARLAARGALRIGAGLVTLAVVREALTETSARVDAIMIREADDASAFRTLLADDRVNSVCIGPGLGLDDRAVSLVEAVLDSKKKAVLDADALTLVGKQKSLRAMLHGGVVLTPHSGEFARLLPQTDKKLKSTAKAGPAYSKVDAAREAASDLGCIVLLKGPDTVVAHPAGLCSINSAHYERAAPWLATAGSGDVLAGFITGLLARGFAPMEAAETGAWLHVECARAFGPGLIAEDLPEQLPSVFRALGL